MKETTDNPHHACLPFLLAFPPSHSTQHLLATSMVTVRPNSLLFVNIVRNGAVIECEVVARRDSRRLEKTVL